MCDFVLFSELCTFPGCWSCGPCNCCWNKIGNAGAKNDRLWIAGAKMVMLAMMMGMMGMGIMMMVIMVAVVVAVAVAVLERYLFMCAYN